MTTLPHAPLQHCMSFTSLLSSSQTASLMASLNRCCSLLPLVLSAWHILPSLSAACPLIIFQDSSRVPLPPGSLPRFPRPGLAPPEQEIGPLSTVVFIMPGTEEGLGECLSNERVSE